MTDYQVWATSREQSRKEKLKRCKNCKGQGMISLGTDMFGNKIRGLKECPVCKGTGKIEPSSQPKE